MTGWRMIAYRIAMVAAAGIGLPYLLLRRRSEVHDRLGGGRRPPRPGSIWIHAASLGEFEAAWPIARVWGQQFGFERLLFSCSNRTALRRLSERLPEGTRRRLAPLDLTPVIRKVLRRERPSCILFVETELWPEWIVSAAKHSIPMAIVSARLSDRSYPSYRRLRWLFSSVLPLLQLVSCRTEEDRRRFCSIGLPRERSFVWGNTKYDAGAEPPARGPLGANDRFLLVAGSMREGEYGMLDLPALLSHRSVRIIVAPRHVGRLDRWERGCIERGLSVRRISWTGIDPHGEVGSLQKQLRSGWSQLPDVILVDRMGVLRALYRIADAAFIGGTWVPIGGHNLFEPAREGIPVLFGPSIETVRDVAEQLRGEGGGWQVEDAAELARVIEALADDPAMHRQASSAARRAAVRLAGGAERTLAGLREHQFPPVRGPA